ncbi:glycosyltransferase family 4 protein [Enterococcus gilvus]|uniref:glycosyltransferase family 4 protein n=1 Tax=Enterococcus gilvus TaxID=160453 RepID=UPI001C8C5481|nr:glycosyltransferase family 4 protein [Enterococcus gilvus]MBX8938053.1 glycosyltransferase family 4 protein [Enterococcus gilvus]
MKVLYIMNNVDKGGAALAFKDMIDEILDEHPEVTPVILLATKNRIADYFSRKSVEIHIINFNNFLTTERHPKIIWKLLLLFRYSISERFFFRKIENEINLDEIDIIHSNLNRFDVGAKISIKYSIPHIWHIREHGDNDFKLLNLLFNDPIKYMNSFDSTFIAISRSVLRKWKSYGVKNIFLVYDGIKITDNDIKESQSNKIKILFLGGITKTKGQDRFLKIISNLPQKYLNEIHIDFVGDGDSKYISFLKNKYNYLKENFTIHPYNNEILKYLKNYDIGVNASFSEGFGRVTVEYLEQGLFVIGANSGASTEIINDNRLGWLVDYTQNAEINAIKLKELIDSRIFDKNRKYRSEYARTNFSMRKHVGKVIEVYRKVSENSYD